MIPILTHPECFDHSPAGGYPERPERLAGVLAHLRQRGWPVEEVEHPGAAAAIDVVHGAAYRERFVRAAARGDGLFDSADNPLSPGTAGAALAAVQVVLAAADRVAAGGGRQVFCAVRPPGHHAERELAMGFCFFNNAAVAAEHLRRRHGCERVAIFDFDVHHGNGTQHLFEERADVFYASLHQWPFYPGTGAAGERGRGAGLGATLNLPLAAGSGDAEARAAVDGGLLPELARFAPELLIVSAGFDAWRGDPLGGLAWSEAWFGELGGRLAGAAGDGARGRVLAVLEGGYDLGALPRLATAFLAGLDAAA